MHWKNSSVQHRQQQWTPVLPVYSVDFFVEYTKWPKCPSLCYTCAVSYSPRIMHISTPPVCRRLWVRYLKLQGHRSEVSHPARRLRWRYWALAPPCWSGMEVRSWRAVRIRRPLWAWPACRMTLVCTVKLPAVCHIILSSWHLPVKFVSCVSHLHAVCHTMYCLSHLHAVSYHVS